MPETNTVTELIGFVSEHGSEGMQRTFYDLTLLENPDKFEPLQELLEKHYRHPARKPLIIKISIEVLED